MSKMSISVNLSPRHRVVLTDYKNSAGRWHVTDYVDGRLVAGTRKSYKYHKSALKDLGRRTGRIIVR